MFSIYMSHSFGQYPNDLRMWNHSKHREFYLIIQHYLFALNNKASDKILISTSAFKYKWQVHTVNFRNFIQFFWDCSIREKRMRILKMLQLSKYKITVFIFVNQPL